MRNLSYYRAGWVDGHLIRDSEFWRTVNGNFLDTCVTEWCKLFADPNGRQHWSQVISDADQFRANLLAHLQLTEDAFATYIRQMRHYRDKFVAHLDNELVMNIPVLDAALSSLAFVYDRLQQLPQAPEYFAGFPLTAAQYIAQSAHEAAEVYQ